MFFSNVNSTEMEIYNKPRPNFQGRVAQWIRRLPTEQEIPGAIPGTFNFTVNLLVNFPIKSPKLTSQLCWIIFMIISKTYPAVVPKQPMLFQHTTSLQISIKRNKACVVCRFERNWIGQFCFVLLYDSIWKSRKCDSWLIRLRLE